MAESQQALASLDGIARTGAGTLLPGHGEPWRGGAEAGYRTAARRTTSLPEQRYLEQRAVRIGKDEHASATSTEVDRARHDRQKG